jgi:hypothetical protein
MRRFKPDPRIDQETEYWTSRHGVRLAGGDTNVATCIDCHGVHGILPISDPQAPVYPTRVAQTCRACHADPEHMKGYSLADGRPIPVDQYDRWRRSVHAEALLEREDLSSPTCNDCHGNHGAQPPGVESIAFVCGQCHGRESDLFRLSPKHDGLQEHNEILAEEEEGCAGCHSPNEPQARVTIQSFTECTVCHDNHAIIRPTVAMLGSLPETPCAFCHEWPNPDEEVLSEPERIFRNYGVRRDELLEIAATQGLEGNRRFDWLVDQALQLPNHTLASEEGAPVLRPQFARLFNKFRIGKTSYEYFDPSLGEDIRANVVNCGDCHAQEPELADEAVGIRTSASFLNRMRELTTMTARAERTILAAQRGGVEVREGLLELDKAVDSQIELEVLVHTFADDDSSAFMKKHTEGMEHSEAALLAGRTGLEELSQRRTGLVVSLVFIAVVLLGLGIKIRQLSRGDDEETEAA